jgi:preprotein translocase subunit SecA
MCEGELKELQMVDEALRKTTGFGLRRTQMLAILLFLRDQKKGRMLLQILTGEGKSVTICCLAAILTMRGSVVDVVTTNELLATRDA